MSTPTSGLELDCCASGDDGQQPAVALASTMRISRRRIIIINALRLRPASYRPPDGFVKTRIPHGSTFSRLARPSSLQRPQVIACAGGCEMVIRREQRTIPLRARDGEQA